MKKIVKKYFSYFLSLVVLTQCIGIINPVTAGAEETCTISFITAGGYSGKLPDSQTITKGTYAQKPDDPVWEGKSFAGWYKYSGSYTNEAFDFSDIVDYDITLYPLWKDIEYTATIETVGNGTAVFSENSETTITGIMGKKMRLNITPDDGYQFSYFTYIDSDGNESSPSTNQLSNVEMPASNITIHVYFALKEYDVYNYSDDEHGILDFYPAKYTEGSTVDITAIAYEGYMLDTLIWRPYSDENDTHDLIQSADSEGIMHFTMPAENVVLIATFKEIPQDSFQVIVVPCGNEDGSGSMRAYPTTGQTGDKIQLFAEPEEGFKFKEWIIISGDATIDGDILTIGTENVKIKAVFEAIPKDTADDSITETSDNNITESSDIPEVGALIKDKKYTYKVTKKGSNDGSTKGELAVTGLKKKSLKAIKIAANVTIDNITYKVTSISSNAFKNNKEITKVTIGKNIKTIGVAAFNGCTKLSQVTINSTVLKTIGKKAFYNNKKLKKVIIKSLKLKTVGKNAFSRKDGKRITFKVSKTKKKAYKKKLKKAKTNKFVVK